MQNRDEKISYHQLAPFITRSANQTLSLAGSEYQMIEGLKAIEEDRYQEKMGKKLGTFGGLVIIQDSNMHIEENDRVLLMNKKNKQLALMSNRILLRPYRNSDAAKLADDFQLQLKYKNEALKIFHFNSSSKELIKNYYLLRERPEVQEVSLEIIENPSVPK